MVIMAAITAITAKVHAAAGVFMALLTKVLRVDQSRVLNDCLAVMALYWVT